VHWLLILLTLVVPPWARAQQADAGLDAAAAQGDALVEAGARRFALTMGRSLALALVARHAQWALDAERDERPLAAALRFEQHGVKLTAPEDLGLSRSLALE